MKTYLIAAALVLVAGVAQADPAVGIWKTEKDDGAYAHVRISPCGTKLCGTIIRTFRDSGEYKSKTIGKQLLSGMAADGDGTYSGGKILQPSSGRQYRSTMTLNGNHLNVAGCWGPICKKQKWQRVE